MRAALLRSSAKDGRAAVEGWARTHVLRVSEGVGYSWEEVLEANADGFLEHEVAELRAWAEVIQPKIDPDFDQVVWGCRVAGEIANAA